MYNWLNKVGNLKVPKTPWEGVEVVLVKQGMFPLTAGDEIIYTT